ncbi:hypothetical protein L228DRAFT_10439 [Xylona heveae TC161]|uniref:Uncharacterized protein n=1 Tax=Xylona heveae (strain CBS 132557 / TC161) TaxID=1328760 RepID=A0A165JKE2_XYLHT|nr:hypothetical protein L228DRAFT_10439 [Xylona heveae TC161]KZF26346.1 hypothetical protein L228DRAFT_10439 [Xylona heveae TC161]
MPRFLAPIFSYYYFFLFLFLSPFHASPLLFLLSHFFPFLRDRFLPFYGLLAFYIVSPITSSEPLSYHQHHQQQQQQQQQQYQIFNINIVTVTLMMMMI